jgi:hypothetical protein
MHAAAGHLRLTVRSGMSRFAVDQCLPHPSGQQTATLSLVPDTATHAASPPAAQQLGGDAPCPATLYLGCHAEQNLSTGLFAFANNIWQSMMCCDVMMQSDTKAQGIVARRWRSALFATCTALALGQTLLGSSLGCLSQIIPHHCKGNTQSVVFVLPNKHTAVSTCGYCRFGISLEGRSSVVADAAQQGLATLGMTPTAVRSSWVCWSGHSPDLGRRGRSAREPAAPSARRVSTIR